MPPSSIVEPKLGATHQCPYQLADSLHRPILALTKILGKNLDFRGIWFMRENGTRRNGGLLLDVLDFLEPVNETAILVGENLMELAAVAKEQRLADADLEIFRRLLDAVREPPT